MAAMLHYSHSSGISSVGRAPASQAGCRRFEPGIPLHFFACPFLSFPALVPIQTLPPSLGYALRRPLSPSFLPPAWGGRCCCLLLTRPAGFPNALVPSSGHQAAFTEPSHPLKPVFRRQTKLLKILRARSGSCTVRCMQNIKIPPFTADCSCDALGKNMTHSERMGPLDTRTTGLGIQPPRGHLTLFNEHNIYYRTLCPRRFPRQWRDLERGSLSETDTVAALATARALLPTSAG